MPRTLIVVAAATLVLALAPSARATTTNVVPNPGFEQGGCGDTAVLCDWLGYPFMSQDTNAHSGNFAMHLRCGNFGCYADGLAPWVSVSAHVDPAACPAIGPGTHAASFWSSVWADAESVGFGATFYSGPGCTGEPLGHDGLGGSPAGGWQEARGTLLAPSGTQSAYLYLGASLPCEDFCSFEASFDDLYLEAETIADSTPPETTITSGPSGTTNSTSATFEFTADEPSTFECSLDAAAFAPCTSPKAYTGLAEGPHSFAVQATDDSGNTDPTPAVGSWSVFTPITDLTAYGSKLKGLAKVDLSWSGPAGVSFDVYRNGGWIKTVEPGTYASTDTLGRGISGSYTYKVCETGDTSICSNEATVTF
jgi:hypothetical protein